MNILIVDDHAIVRAGLRRLLRGLFDGEVLEAATGREALALARGSTLDLVLLDMNLPELGGLELLSRLATVVPNIPVLVLSMHSDDNYVRNALDAGARGYLLKNAIDVDLVGAIKTVAEGRRYMGSGLKYPSAEIDDELERLTAREKQVLQLIAQGKSNKEIAALLDLSVNTVSVHRANLMEKMNIHRTAELVLFAIRKGLVAPQ